MDIQIENHQKKLSLDKRILHKIILKILKEGNIHSAELTVVFVSAQKIRALNKKFMHRAYVTDVLAFDLLDEFVQERGLQLLGDIIISTDAVIQNSKAYGSSFERELTLYIIHGILHLLGYDDHRPSDVKEMRGKEQELLGYLGSTINKVIKK